MERRVVNLAAVTVIGFAIAFGVIVAALIIHNRGYQIDEVEHIHAAYNMRDGRVIYRDFWQGHPPLLYVLLAPVINVDDPVGSFERARLITGALLFATIALVAACAYRIAGTRGALAGAALSLYHTTLIERGMEVRPDGATAFCTLLALYLELRGGDRLRRFCLQSAILGTAFLLTQKALFPAAAFGLWWLLEAWRERKPALVLAPALVWFAPLALALLIMLPFGCAPAFIKQNIIDAFFAGTGAAYRGRFSPLPGIVHESVRNLAFVLLALGGIVVAARRRELRFLALLAIVSIFALWANPFPWPYVHVGALPVLAVTAALAAATLAGRSEHAGVALAIVLAMFTSVPRLMSKAAPSTALQFATLQEVQHATKPDDRLFDLAGLYFRPDAYPPAYAMSGELIRWYMHGGFPRMVPELRKNGCAGVMLNYRTLALGPAERTFLATHFVHYWGYLFLAGTEVNAPDLSFEVLAPREYVHKGSGAISIDGRPFERGVLTRGMHAIHVERAGPSRIILAAPPPLHRPIGPGELYVNFD